MSKRILITGTAGFIGFHLARKLLESGHEVFGIDNFNSYYDVRLKEARHAILESIPSYQFARIDLSDKVQIQQVFQNFAPEIVVNLAAQAGVRYSLINPDAYVASNLVGFVNILECCRHANNKPRLLYASSSSVYGGNKEMPFTEDQAVDHPVSFYAATKKANELMAHCYSHLYGFQTLGFRFFTVYGPWGRPDMSPWLFTEAMMEGRAIKVFNYGKMKRDFTYIDDIIAGLEACINCDSLPLYEIYNIGNHRSEELMDVIRAYADALGIANPKMEMMPMQDGDVPATYASIEKLQAAVGYQPTTSIQDGIPKFVEWYRKWKKDNP